MKSEVVEVKKNEAIDSLGEVISAVRHLVSAHYPGAKWVALTIELPDDLPAVVIPVV